MKNISKKLLFVCLIFFAIVLLVVSVFSNFKTDENDCVISLGNPLSSDGQTDRSLNIWDMQVFKGKIYLGGGSTIENEGPINIWAYNPLIQTFENEDTVDEEAIEHFKIFDNKLYIPAADPRLGDANKFYRKELDGNWNVYGSNSVTLAHVRDLIETNSGDILMVGNNRQADNNLSKPAIAITKDNGRSFQGAGLDKLPAPFVDFNWFFSVFYYKNQIYAPSSLLRDCCNISGSIASYNPKIQKFELDNKITNDEFIPANEIGENRGKYGLNIIYRIWNPVEFKGFLVYPVRSYSINLDTYQEAYMNSLGFYVKEDMGKTPRAVKFPDGSSVGEDVLVINKELYALANQKISPTKFIIYVYKTGFPARDDNWKEVLHFQSTNKARSFEYLDGKFYFGLGQDYGDPIGKSGEILSYCLQENCN
jgi:hypothetical protein